MVSVDVGRHTLELVAALAEIGVTAVVIDGVVEATIDGDEHMDLVRDLVADLGLPLFRLSTRRTSLDEVFLLRSGEPT